MADYSCKCRQLLSDCSAIYWRNNNWLVISNCCRCLHSVWRWSATVWRLVGDRSLVFRRLVAEVHWSIGLLGECQQSLKTKMPKKVKHFNRRLVADQLYDRLPSVARKLFDHQRFMKIDGRMLVQMSPTAQWPLGDLSAMGFKTSLFDQIYLFLILSLVNRRAVTEQLPTFAWAVGHQSSQIFADLR